MESKVVEQHDNENRVTITEIPDPNELKVKGNECFKEGKFKEAIEYYTQAIEASLAAATTTVTTQGLDSDGKEAGEEEATTTTTINESEEAKLQRAVFFNNRAACYAKEDSHEQVIEDCTEALELDPKYIKALVRRAKSYEAINDQENALKDLNQALEIDPSLKSGEVGKDKVRLEHEVKIKHEKLKDEMLGKLKDLGNTVLGKFGMSLDNFEMKQDPSTGSYSISMKR